MTYKHIFFFVLTLIFSILCFKVSAQNYKIKKRRSAKEIKYYNFSNNEIKISNDYLSLNYDSIKIANNTNLFVNDLFENKNLHKVSLENHTLILDAYILMQNNWVKKYNIPIDSSYNYDKIKSTIYYIGDINISNSFSTKVFIRELDWGDSHYYIEELCITADTANILSMSILSLSYSGEFGCCGNHKCMLNMNNIFHKTSIICGHPPQNRGGLIFRRNVKPFHTQYCINFKIDTSTGKIRKLLRINS